MYMCTLRILMAYKIVLRKRMYLDLINFICNKELNFMKTIFFHNTNIGIPYHETYVTGS